MAARLPGRSDNQIKNYWHTHLKNRVVRNDQTESENERVRSPEASENWCSINLLKIPYLKSQHEVDIFIGSIII